VTTFTVAGSTFTIRTPWCDCVKVTGGFTKRADGCWVRPCCNRRTRAMWDKHGDNPVQSS
jgi:hypothetical protein